MTVTWQIEGGERSAQVSVIDRYGRFCAADFPPLDLEEAWIQLANFPMAPEDEELANGDAATSIDGAAAISTQARMRSSAYSVRRMMTLVEDIAAKQLNVCQEDWSMWCNRLEQVLTQSKDSPAVKTFREIALNPLGPLLQSSFRPAYAATAISTEGARYEAALHVVIEAWNLTGQPSLGEL